MKINTRIPVNDLKGAPLRCGEGFLDVGTVIAEAMLSTKPDQKLSADEQISRFTTATDVINEAEINVDAKMFTTIKESIATHFTPLVAGQVLKYLNEVESK